MTVGRRGTGRKRLLARLSLSVPITVSRIWHRATDLLVRLPVGLPRCATSWPAEPSPQSSTASSRRTR